MKLESSCCTIGFKKIFRMILKNRVQKQFNDKASVWKFQTGRSLLIANPVHAVDWLASARGVPMKSQITIFVIIILVFLRQVVSVKPVRCNLAAGHIRASC